MALRPSSNNRSAPTRQETGWSQRKPVFTSSLIAIFLVAENAVAVLPGFRVRPALVLRGMPYAPAQGRSVSPDWIAARNSRVRLFDAHARGSSERDIGRRSMACRD